MPRKFVITGGPCSGKTTTINALKSEFYIVKEAARDIIENEIEQRKSPNKIDLKERQLKILRLQLEREKQAEMQKKDTILDRGIPDGIAYLKLFNQEIPIELLNESKKEKRKYDKIFILDLLPFQKDKIRGHSKETEEMARKIHNFILETYKELNYEIITVPIFSIKDRIKFIKQSIFKNL